MKYDNVLEGVDVVALLEKIHDLLKSTKTTYKVVGGTDIPNLTKQVNKYLSKGWKLQGGISHQGGEGLYYQCLRKERRHLKKKK